MNLKSTLAAASLLFAASVPMAQATTYTVNAEFTEPMTSGNNTIFNGSFDWDGMAVTNLMGTMNEAMNAALPNLNLGFQLATSVVGNIVTTTVFKENSTDVYRGGGYGGVPGSTVAYGKGSMMLGQPPIAGEVANENAYFTLVFDSSTMMGVLDDIEYGDCAAGGLMMSGAVCMSGELTGGSMMGATPLSVGISAVPVPAAAWLFGGALMSLIGANRRKSVLPA
jgi:hypothetical protein